MSGQLPEESKDAARELGKLVHHVIKEPSARESFRGSQDIAGDKGVDVGPIPDPVLATLSQLSDDELNLLLRLNDTFVSEGLYVEVDNPRQLFVF